MRDDLKSPPSAEAASLLAEGSAASRSRIDAPLRTHAFWPWLLVALAAAVRLYWALQPHIVWGDEPFYLWLGQSLLSGHGYQFFGISAVHSSPLFALLAGLLAQAIELFGVASLQALASASAALYVVCGALLVLPIYGFTRRLAGERAAISAGVVTVFLPALTVAIPLWGTMTEPLYLLLAAGAWWGLLVALASNRIWAYAVSGALLALAYLTRSEAVVYMVGGLGVLGLLRIVFAKGGRVRALIGIVLATVIFFVVISPYLIALHNITGKWQLLEEAGSTYLSAQGLAYGDVAAFDRATWGIDPASGEVYLFSSTSESQGLLEAIVADPQGFLRLLRANVIDWLATAFNARLLPWPLAIMAALGLFARPWNRWRLRGEMLLWASLGSPLSFVLFFVQDRYLAGILIPALVWIGIGTAWLGEWLVLSVSRRAEDNDDRGEGAVPPVRRPSRVEASLRAAPALLLALLLLWQAPRLAAVLRHTNSFQPGHLAAAAALRKLGTPSDTVVMSRYPAIAFHGGTAWAPTPAADWPAVVRYARERSARYLVIDAWEGELRPQLRDLLDADTAPPELRHIETVDAGAGPVVIYEFIK